MRSTRMNQNSSLAKRMMFIILTDFFCWFPVIVISILALTGNLNDPTKTIYVWIAVFVLPINSTINPILYTFSTSAVFIKILTWPFKSTVPANTWMTRLQICVRVVLAKEAMQKKRQSFSRDGGTYYIFGALNLKKNHRFV